MGKCCICQRNIICRKNTNGSTDWKEKNKWYLWLVWKNKVIFQVCLFSFLVYFWICWKFYSMSVWEAQLWYRSAETGAACMQGGICRLKSNAHRSASHPSLRLTVMYCSNAATRGASSGNEGKPQLWLYMIWTVPVRMQKAADLYLFWQNNRWKLPSWTFIDTS